MKYAEVLCLYCLWQDADMTGAYTMLTYASLILEIILQFTFALSVLCLRALVPGWLLHSLFGPHELVECVIDSATTFQTLIAVIVKTFNVDGITSLDYWDSARYMRHMSLDSEMHRRLLTMSPNLLFGASKCYVQLRNDIARVEASKERRWAQKVMFALLIRSYGKILTWRLRTIYKVGHTLAVVNTAQLLHHFKDPRFGIPNSRLIAMCPELLPTGQALRIVLHRLCKMSNTILVEAEQTSGDVMDYTRAETRKRLAGLLQKADERRALMLSAVQGMGGSGEGRKGKALMRKWGRKFEEFVQPIDEVLECFRAVLSVAEVDEEVMEMSGDH